MLKNRYQHNGTHPTFDAMAVEWLRDRKRGLTPRQAEILQGLTSGNSVKQMAARLHISTRTVEFHKYRIMAIFGVRTPVELGAYAAKHGLVS